jgi:hypothetical protein
MRSTLLVLALVLLAAEEPEKKAPRKASAIAPSLPALTKEEEEKIDRIVDRLILADTGRLRGEEARKAQKDFDGLKAEAIPSLIRGLNRSAKLNHSCPVLLISKKLTILLLSSNDPELLQYARDEIGADVGRSRYAGTLQELRFKCTMRKNALARLTPPPARGVAAMSTSQLVKASELEGGPKLKAVLGELAKRDGKEVLPALGAVAARDEKDARKLGQAALDDHLGRQSSSQVIEKLGDGSAEVRRSAIRVIAAKHPDFLAKIIDRLTDDDSGVRATARAALVKAAKGEDFGPTPEAGKAEREEARKKWLEWWKRQLEK